MGDAGCSGHTAPMGKLNNAVADALKRRLVGPNPITATAT